MSLQHLTAAGCELFRAVVAAFDRVPQPAGTAIMMVLTVCLFHYLGNSRLAKSNWN
jgi:hypothetical protein